MAGYFEYHASDAVEFDIGDFVGPIELLYTLIVTEGKYDIATFKFATITDTYLERIKSIDFLNLDEASDFTLIAATLIEIKARAIVPIEDDGFDEEQEDYEENPEEDLRRRVMLFGMLKEKAAKLRPLERRGKLYRKPMFTFADVIYVVNEFDLDKLIDAYGRILIRFGDNAAQMSVKKIQKDRFTVSEKIAFMTMTIIEKKHVVFSELFEEDITKGEVITTFQALLELMKKQVVVAEQPDFGGDIFISVSETLDEENIDIDALTQIEE